MNDILNRIQLMAQLSSLAYIEDPDEMAKQVNATGVTFLGLVTNGTSNSDQGDHQAMVARDSDGINLIVGRGTQVEENFNPLEIFDDLAYTPIKSEFGHGHYASGYDTRSLMPAIMPMLNPDAPIDLGGHSKAGSEAHVNIQHFAPHILKLRCFSFGAPACCDKDYWDYVATTNIELYRTIAWHDFAPGWGLKTMVQPKRAVLVRPGKIPLLAYAGNAVYRPLLLGGLAPHDIVKSYIHLLGETGNGEFDFR